MDGDVGDAQVAPVRLGFIGLGNLGRHLAASLPRAGFPLTVHDRDEAAARPLVELGAAWALRCSAGIAVSCIRITSAGLCSSRRC